MNQPGIFILLQFSLFLLLLPPTTPLAPLPTTPTLHTPPRPKSRPTCSPTRPHCIRPRPAECREAITLLRSADPGHPLTMGRTPHIAGLPNAYALPRAWASVPPNCVIAIDVSTEDSVDEVVLKFEAVVAEALVRACVVAGTGCGGEIVVGRMGGLVMRVAYYNDILPGRGVGNGTTGVVRGRDREVGYGMGGG
ncbi:MAG: hypothetical protein Q9220_005481 [cf. Caloplaca sp. 1 TL-2023]